MTTQIGNRLEHLEPKNGRHDREVSAKDEYGSFQNRYQQGAKQIERILAGRESMYEVCVIGLLCEGHVLLDGLPGSGKTSMVKALAQVYGLKFGRIQFTPDKMPEDITGGHILDGDGKWSFMPGPIFANLVLADEINRASPKTQSGMIETMAERQVTSHNETTPLPRPFSVIATINPLEHEGTYSLPEAQLDRFLLKYDVPRLRGAGQLQRVVELAINDAVQPETKFGGAADVEQLIHLRQQVRLATSIASFIERMVYSFDLNEDELEYDPAERAAISLAVVAQAAAMIDGRSYVTPNDVRKHAVSVLHHRLRPMPSRELEGDTASKIVQNKLGQISDPEGEWS